MTAHHEPKAIWPINERYQAFQRPAPARRKRVNWQAIRLVLGFSILWATYALVCIQIIR